MNQNTSLDHRTFSRFSTIYRFGLGAIALSIIFGQFFIQRYLNDHIKDSRIINVAGRQRMLSQKLTKEIVQLHPGIQDANLLAQSKKINTTIALWNSAHMALQNSTDSLKLASLNNSKVLKMYEDITLYQTKIYSSAKRITQKITQKHKISLEDIQQDIDTISKNEPIYLKKMNAIVFEYDAIAKQKVKDLKNIEYVVLFITLLLLLLEIIFLFRPMAIRIRKTISKLLKSEETAKKMAINANNIRVSREASVQELLALNYAMDQTVLFARIRPDGTIVAIGERFAKLLSYDNNQPNELLVDLLLLNEKEESRFENLIQQRKGPVFNQEFEMLTRKKSTWVDVSILPVLRDKGISELLVLCSDITVRKEAQLALENLTAQQYEEREQLQKSRASQVVEAQEEERKRIAREIHDSIGQMLTALKFNIESLNIKNPEKTTQKIEGLKKLTKDLIRGVRMATFNLTPPELIDYGISTALQKMTNELSKLTGKQILFENNSGFDMRLDTLVETNLYRVTQEAVNNAIKYANSDFILVTINHSTNKLSIMINDNGKGFDMSAIPKNPSNGAEGGMGVFFMKERMAYINGRIFINSIADEGTRVTLNYDF